MNIKKWFNNKEGSNSRQSTEQHIERKKQNVVALPPGRSSVPDDSSNPLNYIHKNTVLVNPSYPTELITLIRKLARINPDVGITIQDMFKLANTNHSIEFPNNTDKEAREMKMHLSQVSKEWSTYTAGIHGIINKMLVQCYLTGAISVEAVPNSDLSGLSTIVFVDPESIRFKREKDGVYKPYQLAKIITNVVDGVIPLNPNTYFYVSMYNDRDEPYGIPPFTPALMPLEDQAAMKENFKTQMNMAGLMGFMEATIQKTPKKSSESESAYATRLTNELATFKDRIKGGMIDGVMVGHMDDHEFKFHSTTKDMTNVDKFWNMNQQSVANGLGISGNVIGVSGINTEGGMGIMLSKILSQLKNSQMLVASVLEKIYSLHLTLAGYDNKGLNVKFGTTTVSDELKVQQGLEIKIRNLLILYQQGIISQDDFAWAVGYDKPDQEEPRQDPNAIADGAAQKTKDKDNKAIDDRAKRDKDKTNPKRADQDGRPRTR